MTKMFHDRMRLYPVASANLIVDKEHSMDEQTHTLTGDIRSHPQFESRILRNRRDVLVYLPPGYRRGSRRSYPVLYLHDGQNVFDAATSFVGVEWNADESAQRLINRRLI